MNGVIELFEAGGSFIGRSFGRVVLLYFGRIRCFIEKLDSFVHEFTS